MNRDVLLLIGQTDRPEFQPLAARLTALGEEFGVECLAHADLEEAEQAGGEEARLVLLLESRPGEFPPKGVARFRRLVPGTPLVLIAGSLCQGEGRTGRLPAGVIRFYLYEVETALLPELLKFFRHTPNRLALPATATEEDFWRDASFESADVETIPLCRTVPKRAAVVAADPAMRRLLADSESLGGPAAELASLDELFCLAAEPSRVLIDLTHPVKEFLPRFREVAARFSKSDFLIYAFAPTPEEIALLGTVSEGVAVLPKPFLRLARPCAGTY